jgi:hypothetical protein
MRFIFCKLEAHSGLSHSYVIAASTTGANTSSVFFRIKIRLLLPLKHDIKENPEGIY